MKLAGCREPPNEGVPIASWLQSTPSMELVIYDASEVSPIRRRRCWRLAEREPNQLVEIGG
jgi:hypothetical protein